MNMLREFLDLRAVSPKAPVLKATKLRLLSLWPLLRMARAKILKRSFFTYRSQEIAQRPGSEPSPVIDELGFSHSQRRERSSPCYRSR